MANDVRRKCLMEVGTSINQEDSSILNKASIDRGLFTGSRFYYEKVELEKGEQFDNPDYTRTMDVKKDAVYEYCENGFIKEGTIVRKNYVLVVKVAKIPKPEDPKFLYVDRSLVYKFDEPAVVERVIKSRNDEDNMVAKVLLRSYRPMIVGDKISSRTGNKGICCKKENAVDMLYDERGVSPDIIINSHSIPSRMALNQLTECYIAQVAVRLGASYNATSLLPFSLDELDKQAKSLGIKFHGHKRMYNGRTGNWLDTLIFFGPTTYQRLQKFVIDENYSIMNGPTSALTHQPLDGKANDGGLRLGEMEHDVMSAHGSNRVFHEKFYKDSDGTTLHFCRNCGKQAVVNEKHELYMCKICDDGADIVAVESSAVFNVFKAESEAADIEMTMGLEPHEY